MGKRLKRQLQVRATASTHLRTQVSKVTGGQMGVGKGGCISTRRNRKMGPLSNDTGSQQLGLRC